MLQDACLRTPGPPQLPLLIQIACLSHLCLLPINIPIVLHTSSCSHINALGCQLSNQLLLQDRQGLPGGDALRRGDGLAILHTAGQHTSVSGSKEVPAGQ